MTTAADKIRRKRASRPIYLTLRRMIDAETGEEVKALRASNPIDARLMSERGYRVNHEYRAEIKAPREVWKHRLMHKIGALLVEQVDGFEHKDSHDAIKFAQAQSGICCDAEKFRLDLGQFGVHEVDRNVPRSIAFDSMDEDEFERLFVGVTEWIGKTYAHVMLDEVRAEFWQMANREPVR